jgi:PAS domain S-box-containing protein
VIEKIPNLKKYLGNESAADAATTVATQIDEASTRNIAILAAATDAIIVINEEGLIETFNPAACVMFGYRDDQVIGQNVTMLMPESVGSVHHTYLQRYLTTREARLVYVFFT